MLAHYGENEIKSLLQKIRIFNREIGSYQVFAITENFDYTVKLSNGKMLLKLEELQDDERDALTPAQLTIIANRFISYTSQTSTQERTAPPQSLTTPQKQTPKKKSRIGKTIIIIVVVLIIVVGGLAITNSLSSSGETSSGDSYQEKVMSIEEIERSQPTNFLSADGTYRENIWGDKIKVNCLITNTATVAIYKDAVVRITYYTKTNTELGSTDYTVYEVFPPNSTRTIELKIENYKNVNSIGFKVISALSY